MCISWTSTNICDDVQKQTLHGFYLLFVFVYTCARENKKIVTVATHTRCDPTRRSLVVKLLSLVQGPVAAVKTAAPRVMGVTRGRAGAAEVRLC